MEFLHRLLGRWRWFWFQGSWMVSGFLIPPDAGLSPPTPSPSSLGAAEARTFLFICCNRWCIGKLTWWIYGLIGVDSEIMKFWLVFYHCLICINFWFQFWFHYGCLLCGLKFYQGFLVLFLAWVAVRKVTVWFKFLIWLVVQFGTTVHKCSFRKYFF